MFPEVAAMIIRRDAQSPVSPAARSGSEGMWQHLLTRMMLAGFAVVLALEGWLLWRAWQMWMAP
ncbi:MAG: hypothetical protein ACRDHY_11770 [Anaerolineales bacterium]